MLKKLTENGNEQNDNNTYCSYPFPINQLRLERHQ